MRACKMLSEKLTGEQMQQSVVKKKGKTVLMSNPAWVFHGIKTNKKYHYTTKYHSSVKQVWK